MSQRKRQRQYSFNQPQHKRPTGSVLSSDDDMCSTVSRVSTSTSSISKISKDGSSEPRTSSDQKDLFLSNIINSVLRSKCNFISHSLKDNPVFIASIMKDVLDIVGHTQYDAAQINKKISKSYSNMRQAILQLKTSSIIDPFYQIYIMNVDDEFVSKMGIHKSYIKNARAEVLSILRKVAQKRVTSGRNSRYSEMESLRKFSLQVETAWIQMLSNYPYTGTDISPTKFIHLVSGMKSRLEKAFNFLQIGIYRNLDSIQDGDIVMFTADAYQELFGLIKDSDVDFIVVSIGWLVDGLASSSKGNIVRPDPILYEHHSMTLDKLVHTGDKFSEKKIKNAI